MCNQLIFASVLILSMVPIGLQAPMKTEQHDSSKVLDLNALPRIGKCFKSAPYISAAALLQRLSTRERYQRLAELATKAEPERDNEGKVLVPFPVHRFRVP